MDNGPVSAARGGYAPALALVESPWMMLIVLACIFLIALAVFKKFQ